MPRAEVGTPKYLANKMKSKGLQRLRWYCQVCEKQCRDENGFKCHAASESHLRQMLVVGESAGKHISDYSGQFQSEFVTLLSRRWGTKRVKANNVYQEYIQDKHHVHMNSTRWLTLTEFIKHLGRTGVAHVDDTEKGWFIAWIDSSPKALEKQEASLKKERATMSDEMRQRLLIEEQIERAAAEEREAKEKGEGSSGSRDGSEEADGQKKTVEEGLKRDEGEKVVLSMGFKPAAAKATTPAAAPVKFNAFKMAANPLKKMNALKQTASPSPIAIAGMKRKEMTAAERLIQEDQERKRRRMEREATTA
ncbi:uncharacterized protein STEHIDRAFT_125001 [Stereum hirsutum FP-91666 SS1]|uniref:uncharacterized protein n=1 Tax=Stereum hirsutum (strain FP-91666) TaxID=721885 RepID=UPI000444A3B8|nr:uncharacterized protein STEHIDRAFT_125001 [Stereum hirsutum FP-91666 SS1]EIM81414.1 hypothetical protein STEHIDRAFT_125001 [Stereum hirsutum FP-91666 SS1]